MTTEKLHPDFTYQPAGSTRIIPGILYRKLPILIAPFLLLLAACDDFAPPATHRVEPAAVAVAEPAQAQIAPARSAPVQTALVRFTGRFDFSSPEGPRFAWPGSSISARFSGSAVSVRLRQFYSGVDDTGHAHRNRFYAFIDKQPPIVLVTAEGSNLYEVARGLPAGEHELLLYKITEALVGEVQYLGLELPHGGRLLPPAPPPARQIEIIGASVAAGYGNEGSDEKCTFTAATQNEYWAFGAVAARELEAEHTTIAWSGKGLLRNFDESTSETMATLHARTLPERPGSVWEGGGSATDAIIVNLPGSDFYAGGPSHEAFVAAYRELLVALRKASPSAHLFAAIGPTMTDNWPPGRRPLSTARAWVSEVVDALRRTGDLRVHFLEFPMQDGTRGCAHHPSMKTHRRMADLLVAALKKELGW